MDYPCGQPQCFRDVQKNDRFEFLFKVSFANSGESVAYFFNVILGQVFKPLDFFRQRRIGQAFSDCFARLEFESCIEISCMAACGMPKSLPAKK